MKEQLAKLSFYASIIIGLFGQFISFYPGADCNWYITVTLLTTPALFLPNKKIRFAAIILVILGLAMATRAYKNGNQYKEWLKSLQQQNEQLLTN